MKNLLYTLLLLAVMLPGCMSTTENLSNEPETVPFVWDNANIYFLLTDRFYNGNEENDINFDRTVPTAMLRGFEGGDIKGITQKLNEGYFNDLGVTALWFSPVVEQGHGIVDEGTGKTYGFHGYWTKDWTNLDPNFGTEEELEELIDMAHQHGIRVIMDVVLNHTGPVTEMDPVWPNKWVRTKPACNFQDYEGTVTCTLVKNLPDIKTESDKAVELPESLTEKWESEGRLEQELAELDEFFERTGYPRAPKYYIIKWIIDLIKDYGVDGFRIDTAKHVEESVWEELKKQAEIAFAEWKATYPEKVLDDNDFYMMGEVYNYGISTTFAFDFGDKKVNYFDYGFSSLINFEFKDDANKSYEEIFTKYSELLNGELKSYGVVNYISSHDDGGPFDKFRKKPFDAGTKLLLCPGTVQTYYGDETARSLDIPGTQGDATLRSNMNWNALAENHKMQGYTVGDVLTHWQKIGQFRASHPAIGAGIHNMISEEPYIFTRTFQQGTYKDLVLVGLDLEPGKKEIEVNEIFIDGTRLKDYYSGQIFMVKGGKVSFESEHNMVLIGH